MRFRLVTSLIVLGGCLGRGAFDPGPGPEVVPGTIDVTFGDAGVTVVGFGDKNDYGSAMALQDDGGVLLAGRTLNARNSSFALTRLNADGSLDATFGIDGVVIIDVGNDWGYWVGAAPDGSILLVGDTYAGGQLDDYVALRFHADGSLDDTFAAGGTLLINWEGDDSGRCAHILPDGSFLIAGTVSYDNASARPGLARVLVDGTLDPAFGTAGRAELDLGGRAGHVTTGPDGLTVNPVDGTASLIGRVVNVSNDLLVARYDSTGVLDTGFDGDGVVELALSPGDDFANAATLDGDGRLVVAGTTRPDSVDGSEDLFVLRLETDGTLDGTFAEGGVHQLSVSTETETVSAIAVQPDGRIVVVGTVGEQTRADAFVVRFLPSGGLDATFGESGVLILDPYGDWDVARDVSVVEVDGRATQIIVFLQAIEPFDATMRFVTVAIEP